MTIFQGNEEPQTDCVCWGYPIPCYYARHGFFLWLRNNSYSKRWFIVGLCIISLFLFYLVYTYYISSALFAIFGLKMLHEGYHMSATEGQEEFEEVNEELRKREEKESRGDIESGGAREVTAASLLSKIFIQSFTMTMLAEWGDRSQLATVILAAREDVYGVCVGGVLGHALCTGLAVVGGRLIAQRISVKTVTLVSKLAILC